MKRPLKRLLARTGYEIRKRPPLLAGRPAAALRFDLSHLLADTVAYRPAAEPQGKAHR